MPRLIFLIQYLGAGIICHLLFVGQTFDWSSAWTWLWLIAWPWAVFALAGALALCGVVFFALFLAILKIRLWILEKI